MLFNLQKPIKHRQNSDAREDASPLIVSDASTGVVTAAGGIQQPIDVRADTTTDVANNDEQQEEYFMNGRSDEEGNRLNFLILQWSTMYTVNGM